MKQIRRKVFETNSSSMHSIAVVGENNREKPFSYGEVVYVSGGEYGWGPDVLTGPMDKLNYIFTSLFQHSDNYDDIMDSVEFEILKKVVKDYTGAELVIDIDGELDCLLCGYIDHQSQGMLNGLIENEDNLKEFIFNDKYEIIIDNDNSLYYVDNYNYNTDWDCETLDEKYRYESDEEFEERKQRYYRSEKLPKAYSSILDIEF